MGFFSRLFAASKTGANVADDSAIAQQAQTEKIEALLESVNSASQHVRNYYITFLLAGFYIAMIIWSTTDLMLLKDTPVKMPLLEVELPITGFYTFAPYFFLLLHFNLLLQFSLLSDKIHRFNRAIIDLADPDSRRYYYTRLFAFAFTQTLSGQHHSRLLRFLLTLMVWISAIWLPLAVLIGLQVGFLAYHAEDILFSQRIAVMLDLLVLFIFWPMIRANDNRWRSWVGQAVGLPWLMQKSRSILGYFRQKVIGQRTTTTPSKEQIHHANGYPLLEGSISAVTGLCAIAFVWGVAVLPDSDHESWVAENIIPENWKTGCALSSANKNGKRYFRLTEFLFDGRQSVISKDENGEKCKIKTSRNIFNRNLIIRQQLLIADELKAEDEADLISTDESLHQAALKKVTGLVLSGRDLRYADFSGARLPKVNFVGADNKPSKLSYANFSYALLIDAHMMETKLQGADLRYAKLQGADLNNAQLQRADLRFAKLQGADLRSAKLQGADLYFAQLQGATLFMAELQGAYLAKAQLQGADLGFVQLQGADLIKAELQGADLRNAQLQGANLVKSQLQGADLSNVQLQGTDLRFVQLQGASYLSRVDFSHSDITGTEFGFLTLQAFQILQTSLAESIQDKKLLKRINDTLTGRTKNQSAIFPTLGKDVRDNQLDRTRLYGFWNGLEAAENKMDYQNKLAAYLIELSCQNRWTAAGIARHRIEASWPSEALWPSWPLWPSQPIPLASTVAQCMLSLKDQKNKAEQPVCPALSKIDKDTVALLERAAARKNDDTAQSTFACQTSLSDQPQSSE